MSDPTTVPTTTTPTPTDSPLTPLLPYLASPTTRTETLNLLLSYTHLPALFPPPLLTHLIAQKDTHEILINITAQQTHLTHRIYKQIEEKTYTDARYTRALANVTRWEEDYRVDVRKCIEAFMKEEGDQFMGYVLMNVTRFKDVRDTFPVEDLFCMLNHSSSVRKLSAASTIKNCLFSTERHVELLENTDLLVSLVLPLYTGSLTPEEEEALPSDLQFLEGEKKLQTDPEFRGVVLDILFLLCSTRDARDVVRRMNVYPILREYHLSERDEQLREAVERVVDLVMRSEEEVLMDGVVPASDE